MGIYTYTDPQTGQSYQFEHAGEAPTNEDFAFIADYVRGQREQYSERYKDLLGEEFEPDDGTALGRGLDRAFQNIRSAVGETIGTAGEKTGLGFLETFGEGMEEKGRQSLGQLLADQPERLQSTDVDSLSSALTFAGEVVGEQLPQLGLGIGAAAIGTAVAPAIPFAGAVAGVTAAGTVTAPILFGNNIQRQEDEVAAGNKDSVDVEAALKATFGQATLEGIADKLLLGGLFRPLGRSIFTRTTSRAAGGATTEGLTEVGQQMLERSQAGLSIDSEDAIAEYREAAIAGGLIGGGTRATFGAFQGSPDKVDTDPTDQEVDPEVNTEAVETTKTGDSDATNTTGDTTVSEGTGTGDGRSESGVVGGTGTGSGDTDTEVTASSDDGSVGRGELPVNDSTTSSTDKSNTLATEGTKTETEAINMSGMLNKKEETTDTLTDDQKEIATILRKARERELAGKTQLITQKNAKILAEAGLIAEEDTLTPMFTNAKVRELLAEGPESVLKRMDESDTLAEATTTGTTDTDVQEQEQEQEAFVEELEEQVEKQTATPVQTIGDTSELTQAELFDGLPTTPRGEVGVRDTQGPLPNVIPQGQPTLPLQQPQGVGPRGLVTPPPPTGVPTTGQTTGTAGQIIPPGVQVPATPRVVGAPVQQEVLQAAEVERQTAAQQRIEKIFDSNLGKQRIRREYHDAQVDPRMIPDTATALDKEAVADLIEAKDETLDANAKAAKLFFKRFRRPIDAVSEIGAVIANGPTQQSLETDKISGGKTKKKKPNL